MATVKREKAPENKIFLLIPLFLLIALWVFLGNKDGGISGAQALGLQGAAFWVVAILGIVVAGFLGYKVVKGEQDGTGTLGKSLVFIAIACVILFSVFAKACETKADPVTGPNYEAPK